MSRQIYTRAIRYYSRKSTAPIIELRLRFPPHHDDPVLFNFTSIDDIRDFLQPNRFLVDVLTKTPITIKNAETVIPDRVYNLFGVDFTYHPDDFSREKVTDKVFEEKAALALKEVIKKEDPGIVELPRVIRSKAGEDVAEWQAVFESSDGCIIFLEANFRMSIAHVYKQSKRMSKSLRALGKQNIRPNGEDLTVEVMAAEKEL